MKPISHLLPYRVVSSFPVVGEINLELPDTQQIIFLSDGCDSLATRLYWNGIDGFEPETINLFMKLLHHSSTVFDVGAHVGLYALLAATKRNDMDVHAFEPVPRIYNYLINNIAVNDVQNIKPVPNALSNLDGEISIYVPNTIRLPATASLLGKFREETEEILVATSKIDTYVAENNISQLDLIKIDAEGAEVDVLDGAKRTLERDKPIIICEVLYGYTDSKMQDIFDEIDYRFFLITSDGLVPHERIIGDDTYFFKNYLFISESKLAQLAEDLTIL